MKRHDYYFKSEVMAREFNEFCEKNGLQEPVCVWDFDCRVSIWGEVPQNIVKDTVFYFPINVVELNFV